MKCVKCGLRKGKRACPALKGDICAQCCGTHRLKEIACPADCSWLGGLAVLAGGGEAVEPRAVLRAARGALEKVAQWSPPAPVKKTMATNALTFIGEEGLDERDDWHEDLLAAAVFLRAIDGSKKPAEVYLEAHARDLPKEEVAALQAMLAAKLAVHRVKQVSDEAGCKRVTVTDIVTKEDSEVIVSAMSRLDDGDLSVGWLASIGGAPHLLFEVPVLEQMDELVVEEWQRRPGAVTFMKFIRDEGHAHWEGDSEDQRNEDVEEMLRAEEEDLAASFDLLTASLATWMDAPNPLLDGQTPREAATNPQSVPGPIDHLVDDLEAWANAELERRYPWEDVRAALGIPRRHIDGYVPTYDPREEPDARWFQLHEDTQIESVEAHHEALGDKHPNTDDDSHDVVHATIERMLKANQHGAREALDRLKAAGLTRHEAVHALVDVFSKSFFEAYEDDDDDDDDGDDGDETDVDDDEGEEWIEELPKRFLEIDPSKYRGTAA